MSIVKAKFICNAITDFGHSKKAELSAVYGKEGENADFSNGTPSGSLSINISKDTPAAEFFTPQKQYYLTFEEAPEVKI